MEATIQKSNMILYDHVFLPTGMASVAVPTSPMLILPTSILLIPKQEQSHFAYT